MKRVLIFIPWFSPAYKAGGPVRSIENLLENYNNNIEYCIICGNRDVDGTIVDHVEFNKWVSYGTHTKVWYKDSDFSIHWYRSIFHAIKPTHTFIIGIFSWNFNLKPLLMLPKKKLILSARGMLHPNALQQKAFKKRILLSLFRRFNITDKIIFHATDITEKVYIGNQFGHNNSIIVAANYPTRIKYTDPPIKTIGKINLLTHALISPMKNHLLILQSLMLCKGEVVYDIVGAIKDKDYWNQCLKIIASLPSNITVQYHGEQSPKAIEHFLKNTHLLVLPSESENYGHSIIEGLFSGRPVITSKNTPWNQLSEYKAGFNVGIDVKEIAEKINYFMELNTAQYVEHTLAARIYADHNIDFNQIHQQYDDLFA